MKSNRIQLLFFKALIIVMLLGVQHDARIDNTADYISTSPSIDAPILSANMEERALSKDKKEKSNPTPPSFQFPNIFDALRLIF